MNDPKRILVCGDWHGDFRAAQAAARQARRVSCELIVQCGDFGFWPHQHPEYVTQVNSAMKKNSRGAPLYLVWVDGNHENFDMLYATEWPRTPKGFWKLADHVYYAPRGLRWTWGHTKFIALGGGYSMDKQWRLSEGPVGQYWWPQETITIKQVYDILNDGQGEVDVMFAHDMPEGAQIGIPLMKMYAEDEQNRTAVRTVVEHVKPKDLYHGHYHHWNESTLSIPNIPPVRIHSLDMYRGGRDEHNTGSWTVLDIGKE